MVPITGTNMTRQMRRLFPKINCVNAPSLPIVVTVWLRSLLIWFASWELIGMKLPTMVIANATSRMNMVDKIRLRRGEALVHISMLNLINLIFLQSRLWRTK